MVSQRFMCFGPSCWWVEAESVGGGGHWRWILRFLSWLRFLCALPPDCRYCVIGCIFLVTWFPGHDGQPYTELWITINPLFSWFLSSICCLREKNHDIMEQSTFIPRVLLFRSILRSGYCNLWFSEEVTEALSYKLSFQIYTTSKVADYTTGRLGIRTQGCSKPSVYCQVQAFGAEFHGSQLPQLPCRGSWTLEKHIY